MINGNNNNYFEMMGDRVDKLNLVEFILSLQLSHRKMRERIKDDIKLKSEFYGKQLIKQNGSSDAYEIIERMKKEIEPLKIAIRELNVLISMTTYIIFEYKLFEKIDDKKLKYIESLVKDMNI